MTKKFLGISFFAVAICITAIIQYGFLPLNSSGFFQQKKEIILPDNWKFYFYSHIFFSAIALGLGFIQFIKRIRIKNIQIHKLIGFIYLFSILLGGGSGFYIAFYATGGLLSTFGFGTLAVLWIVSGLTAFYYLIESDYYNHGRWMIRSYGLTFAAVTLRIYLPISIALFGIDSFPIYYSIISWISWLTNIIIVELFLLRKNEKV